MTPRRELLLEQASSCRQLALIADPAEAAKLRKLADDYEAEALLDKTILALKSDATPSPTDQRAGH
jgi:hypothetical protein